MIHLRSIALRPAAATGPDDDGYPFAVPAVASLRETPLEFDAPEAPLSPVRQLALLAILLEMTGAGESQFIIATHSPLLMAFPGATIYSLDGGMLHRVAWEELEHVSVTRDFLNDPGLFLRQLSD